MLQVVASGHLDEVQELGKLDSAGTPGSSGTVSNSPNHRNEAFVHGCRLVPRRLRFHRRFPLSPPPLGGNAALLTHMPLLSHQPVCAVATTAADSSAGSLVLKERELLGEGAFSRVSEVVQDSSQRTFALKRMTKTAALQCPEHVYCEQWISKNTTNAFCIRQYASFKVRVFQVVVISLYIYIAHTHKTTTAI